MIWLLLPLLLCLVFAELRCRQQLLRLIPDPAARLLPGARLLPDVLVLIASGLILLSLQPVPAATPASAPGPAVALVVDVSQSMQVKDQQPDRLTLAKHELLTLIDIVPDARFSLIPFAGEAVLQVPLTIDRNGLRFFIDNLHSGLIAAPGSAPEEAIVLAQKSLQEVKGERLIVLLSDGERTVAELPPLLSESIPVYSILVGTKTGGLVENIKGALSQADTERLVSISRQTGGQLLKGSITSPAAFELPISKTLSETADPTPILLIIALFLIVLRWVPLPLLTGHLITAALLLMTPLFPGCENSVESVQSPRALFGQGIQAARSGETTAALEAFASATERLDGRQRGTALYNHGTLLLEAERPDEAIILLEQALILMPGDKAARDNLLLALAQQSTVSTDGKGAPKAEDPAKGEKMSLQQAQQLLDSVQLDPTAPPTEATIRPPTVLKEW